MNMVKILFVMSMKRNGIPHLVIYIFKTMCLIINIDCVKVALMMKSLLFQYENIILQ